MKITAVIPIKLNNQRLPGKNIKKLDNGKPLINFILESLSRVEKIDEIYVFCSDESIKEYLPSNVKFLKRDVRLDSNDTNCSEILESFTQLVESDIYVYTHATAPFIQSETINKCIDKVVNEDYDSALTVTKLQDFVWKDNKPLNFDAEKIPRSQDLEVMYIETSGLYVFKKHVFTELHRRVGVKPYMCEVSRREAIDINYKEDFDLANIMLKMKGDF